MAPVIPVTQEEEVGGSWSKANPRKSLETLSEKQIKSKKDWSMAQVVEHLPNKPEVLSSVPHTIPHQISLQYRHDFSQ
jgi:hypothetical protein